MISLCPFQRLKKAMNSGLWARLGPGQLGWEDGLLDPQRAEGSGAVCGLPSGLHGTVPTGSTHLELPVRCQRRAGV